MNNELNGLVLPAVTVEPFPEYIPPCVGVAAAVYAWTPSLCV